MIWGSKGGAKAVMLLKKPVSKRKTRRTAEHTVKSEKLKNACMGANKMLKIILKMRLSRETRCFPLRKVKLKVAVRGAS